MDHGWWTDDGKSVKSAALTNRTNFINAVFIANLLARFTNAKDGIWHSDVCMPVCGMFALLPNRLIITHWVTDMRIDYWVRCWGYTVIIQLSFLIMCLLKQAGSSSYSMSIFRQTYIGTLMLIILYVKQQVYFPLISSEKNYITLCLWRRH